MTYKPPSTPGWYKKNGTWYQRVYGPGPDIPHKFIGPGSDTFDPRPIGPRADGKGPLLNTRQKRSQLEETLEDEEDKR